MARSSPVRIAATSDESLGLAPGSGKHASPFEYEGYRRAGLRRKSAYLDYQ
jgi:hypothetical protein